MLIAAIVSADTSNEVYAKVKDVIHDQSRPIIWVPSRESLWRSHWPLELIINSTGTSVVTFIALCAVMMLQKSFFAFPISSRDRSFKQYLAWDECLLSFNIFKRSLWMLAVLHYSVRVWFLQCFSYMMIWKDRIPICWSADFRVSHFLSFV